MAVEQLFYTSCKKGMSPGMGFQTYSMSKGITDGERKEIESYCVYIPPDNLPTQPSDDEIESMFPEAFSYFILSNGKYCICRSRYVGKDYSGRYGNYFCHVLVSDRPWDFYPIQLYGSGIFKNHLTLEEKNAEEIGLLPPVSEIRCGSVINFDTISDFLKKNGIDRGKKFIDIMQSVVLYSSYKKRIIFSDSRDNAAFWIGAIEMSMPMKLAAGFTFTTYCYNPDDVNYVICNVDQRGSRFDFNDVQKKYKYDAFNFNLKCSSSVACRSSFVKRAEVGYTVSKEVFMPFLKFLEQFDYSELHEDIDNSIILYNIVKNGLDKCDIEDVKNALSFAVKYKSESAYNELFKEINSKLDRISTQVDIELTEMITIFLLKAGKSVDNKKYIVNAYRFFFNSLKFIVSSNESIPLEDVLDLYKKMREIHGGSTWEFVCISLNSRRINEIQDNIHEIRTRGARYYLITILSDIVIFNRECNLENKKVLFGVRTAGDKSITLLLNSCLQILIKSEKDILYILNYFKNNYECGARIILRIYYINSYLNNSSNISDLLAKFIVYGGKDDSTWEKKIYSYISKLPGSGDFLMSVYKFELRCNIDNNTFFMDYCGRIFYFLKEYASEKFSDALKLYLEVYDASGMTLKEYKKILNYIGKNSLIEVMEKSVFEKFIGDMEEKFTIENSDMENDTIERILKLKKKYSLKTPCSITELLYIGKRIKDPDLSCREDLLDGVEFNFSNMTGERYEGYLRWFLPNVCVEARSVMDHTKIQKIFFCRKYSDIFYNVYMDIIFDIVFTKKYKLSLGKFAGESYKILLDFFISVFRNKDGLKSETKDIMRKRTIDMLSDISDKILDEYTVYIRDRTNRLKNVFYIREEWMKIRKALRQKNEKNHLFKFLKK